jgi:hypothetical protein
MSEIEDKYGNTLVASIFPGLQITMKDEETSLSMLVM